MVNISASPPHFTTKVLRVKNHVSPTLISQVTQLPIVPNPGFPFPTPDQPNCTDMQARFNPTSGHFWLEHEKSVSIGYLSALM